MSAKQMLTAYPKIMKEYGVVLMVNTQAKQLRLTMTSPSFSPVVIFPGYFSSHLHTEQGQ